MKKLIVVLSFLMTNNLLALELVGQGEYSWFVFDIYKVKLWSSSDSLDKIYKKELKLELEYARDFKGEDISKQSEKEMLSAGLSKKYIDQWRSELYSAFPNIKEGDKLRAHFIPSKGVHFYHNDELYSSITNDEFATNFLNIWLGEKTSAPELREELIRGIK